MLNDVSSNGIWIGGHKVQPRRFMQLQPGDRISFLPPEMGNSGVDVPAYELVKGKSSGPIGRASSPGRRHVQADYAQAVQAYRSRVRDDLSSGASRPLYERGGASRQDKSDLKQLTFPVPEYPSRTPRSLGEETGHAQLELEDTASAGKSTDVSFWIRSVGSGGKLSDRLMAEIEDTYDHLAQIFDNYEQHIEDFYDAHEVIDLDEQDILSAAVKSLCELVGDR